MTIDKMFENEVWLPGVWLPGAKQVDNGKNDASVYLPGCESSGKEYQI